MDPTAGSDGDMIAKMDPDVLELVQLEFGV
jgi:hypothetical protein